ncbi:aspartate-semialdehyde dehydrogenase [Sinosporangium siamense]|uniref:aspartate-semialdehyde dehydrogenase n=1 Tax=Sinosporangium siamense TaxID=1367973 RepID=A0A919VGE4_9ACTN|nr:aspartate-semialdehyde dehydrogenase [Sinosporangium siamense]GII97024.1 aspartate-semialdehyde dehydrogenase [Sinosporangium siamense]
MSKIGVGLLGVAGKTPFAYIGQRGLGLYEDHPWFEVRAVIADDPADVGRTLGEVVADRWLLDEPLPAHWADVRLAPIEEAPLRDAGVEFVLSGLPGPHARALDPQLAAMGFGVVSESAGLRLDDDVPLIVPEINPGHLALAKSQVKTRGYGKGFLIASPLCTAVIVGLALKPLQDAYGVDSVVATTLQALSGAGKSGVAALQVVDNLLPYIADEEEKLSAELAKIFGTLEGDRVVPWSTPLASTCTRVPVRDGHTAVLSAALGASASPAEIAEVLGGFKGLAAEHKLPSAPAGLIVVREEPDRPQPFLDRTAGDGRSVSVGRIRTHEALTSGVSLVAVGHNHDRGTVGNALLLTELVAAAGLIDRA